MFLMDKVYQGGGGWSKVPPTGGPQTRRECTRVPACLWPFWTKGGTWVVAGTRRKWIAVGSPCTGRGWGHHARTGGGIAMHGQGVGQWQQVMEWFNLVQ